MKTKILTLVIATFFYALGLNLFLEAGNIYATGVTGISLILSDLTSIETATFYILINIPLIIFSFIKIGKKFTIYSFFSIALTTIFIYIIPSNYVITTDPLLNSIFAGIIMGISVGFILKEDSSTGGTDFIALYMSLKKGKSFGIWSFIINAFIIILAGIVGTVETALYTIINTYVFILAIDFVYNYHQKVTLFIITNKEKEVADLLHKNIKRGITSIPAKGTYSNEDKNMLVIVCTKQESNFISALVNEVDQNSFINITKTEDVRGLFTNNQINQLR